MHYALPRSMPLSVPLLSLQPATFLLLGLGSGALSRQCLLWTLSPGVLGTIDIWDQHCLSPQSSAANPASLQSPLPTGQALGPWEQPHPFLSKPLPLGTLRLSAAPHTRPPDRSTPWPWVLGLRGPVGKPTQRQAFRDPQELASPQEPLKVHFANLHM